MSKVFYCPYCEKETTHYEKNAQERLSCFGKSGEVLGWLMDKTGTYTTCKYVLNDFEWKCSECGLGTQRRHDGEITGKTWNF